MLREPSWEFRVGSWEFRVGNLEFGVFLVETLRERSLELKVNGYGFALVLRKMIRSIYSLSSQLQLKRIKLRSIIANHQMIQQYALSHEF
jgi:hypothetical protein